MCVELMLNAANLAFVTFARLHGHLDGQMVAFFVMVVAAAEADSPRLEPLWALLRSGRFRAAVQDLGGYGTEEMGRRIR